MVKDSPVMTTIVFRDTNWEVATPAWSAATKTQGRIVLCYLWTPASGTGFHNSATGLARVVLEIDMQDFLRRIAPGGIIDLHDISTKSG